VTPCPAAARLHARAPASFILTADGVFEWLNAAASAA
jgi:hypothetical protein